MNGRFSRIIFSISTGATFSPPAVIMISLILPVMFRFSNLSSLPTSPLCKKPYSSIV